MTFVGRIQWGGKMWSGYEISHVLCRMGGVGAWVLLFSIHVFGSMVSSYVSRGYMYIYTWLIKYIYSVQLI